MKAGKMTSLLAAKLDPSGGVVAGPSVFGGVGVALPCASAKRSRLLPQVFDMHHLRIPLIARDMRRATRVKGFSWER